MDRSGHTGQKEAEKGTVPLAGAGRPPGLCPSPDTWVSVSPSEM